MSGKKVFQGASGFLQAHPSPLVGENQVGIVLQSNELNLDQIWINPQCDDFRIRQQSSEI